MDSLSRCTVRSGECVVWVSISTLRLQFTEILTRTCNLNLSTEQEEAVFDLFETDVRAVTLAAVECSYFQPLFNFFFPQGVLNNLRVFRGFLIFPVSVVPTNIAPFAALLFPTLESVRFDFSQITDLAVQEELRSTFFDGYGRCLGNISEQLRSDFNAGFSFLFAGQ